MESITYACLADSIVVIRVHGAGNHNNSFALREVYRLTSGGEGASAHPRYVLDLHECPAMDSTFMGIIASIALNQFKTTKTRPVVVNLTQHVRDLLSNLGLKHVLELRPAGDGAKAADPGKDAVFSGVEPKPVEKLERIILMIEAHEKLIDASSLNEAQFRGVLQSLKESLDRVRGQRA